MITDDSKSHQQGTYPMMKAAQKRPLLYIGGAIALIQLALAAPAINAQLEQQEQQQAVRQTERQQQAQMLLNDKARRERSAIALQRYESGCLRVVNRDNQDRPIALRPGDVVLDYYNDVPIAPGLIVCDGFGVTGVVGPDYKITEVAVLLNLSQIPDAMTQVNGGNPQ